MGTCEESSPSLETHSEINLGISTNGTQHDVGDDDLHQYDQIQSTEEEVVVQKLEKIELEGIEGGATYEEEEEEEGKAHFYPSRPNAVDCAFYLKTGTCKFGLNCRFNHPSKRVFQPVGDKEKGVEESNGSVVDSAKIECKYFLTPGGCKFGDACRFNHSRQKSEAEGPELNFLGLPIRPLEKECTFYMRNGSCAYGANCRFNHPDPTAVKESEHGNSLAHGESVTELSNGLNLRNSLPYAPGMSSYHQAMPPNPRWNQNQVTIPLSANMPPLPHQIMNNFSMKADTSTHHEQLIQIEEFPQRPGQPDCDYFMKTGDCKYRSACRYNHPISRATKLRLPPVSVKGRLSRPSTAFPVETTRLPDSNPVNTRKNGVASDYHLQQMQNEKFPERPGQQECEYFMKTGDCKFKSACRYHHPRNRFSTSPACALNENGLPLRPDSRVCRNYLQQGTCKYGINCLFHHPDSTSPAVAAQDQTSKDIPAAAGGGSESQASNNAVSGWDDGWAM